MTEWRDGDSQSAVSVKSADVLDVIRNVQIVVRMKNAAAKVILGLNAANGSKHYSTSHE